MSQLGAGSVAPRRYEGPLPFSCPHKSHPVMIRKSRSDKFATGCFPAAPLAFSTPVLKLIAADWFRLLGVAGATLSAGGPAPPPGPSATQTVALPALRAGWSMDIPPATQATLLSALGAMAFPNAVRNAVRGVWRRRRRKRGWRLIRRTRNSFTCSTG